MVRARRRVPLEDHESVQESSDDSDEDDDEYIPNEPVKVPAKQNGAVTLRPQDHNRPPKRALSREISLQSPRGLSKRQKTGNAVPGIQKRDQSLTPASLLKIAPPTVSANEVGSESSDSGSERGVSDEMVHMINFMLKPRNMEEHQYSPEESPTGQLLEEQSQRQIASGGNLAEGTKAGVQEPLDGLNDIDKPHAQEEIAWQRADSSSPHNDHGDLVASDAHQDTSSQGSSALVDNSPNLNEDHVSVDVLAAPLQQPPTGQLDPYEIPSSPLLPTGVGKSSTASETNLSQCNSRNGTGQGVAQCSKPNRPRGHKARLRVRKRDRLTKETTGALSSIQTTLTGSHRRVQVVQETAPSTRSRPTSLPSIRDDIYDPPGDDKDHENYEEFDGSVYRDIGHTNLIAEETFSRDVEIFRNRDTLEGEELPDLFRGPPQDDTISIHLQPDRIKQAMKLMRVGGWTGLSSDWPDITLDVGMAATKHTRHIIPLLEKLKRLYLASPRAPYLRDQNKFLAEHSQMISYYVSQMQQRIDCLLRERTQRPPRNMPTTSQYEQNSMNVAEDIVSFIIPMMLQVLNSAWKLGGDTQGYTQFTAAAVELLGRGTERLGLLYQKALQRFNEEEPPGSQRERGTRAKQRENFRPLLSHLIAQIRRAPDLLAKEREEVTKKQEYPRRQEEVRGKLERDKAERQQRIREQNRRALQSLAVRTRPRDPF